MIVERMELSKPYYQHRDAKCCKSVRDSGVAFDNPNMRKCDRRAVYKMNGKGYCVQHAGEVALKHLIKQQEAQRVI